MRIDAPSRLNRYLLGEVIGAGGMGTVVRATDEVLGREVAVKLLREELAGDPAALVRFRQEARIAASLSHPGIAAVYDFLEQDGRQAIVMELLDGQDLHAVLERDGAMAPETAARIAAEVADALAYAHANGAVHRDVKPANIFLTRAGEVKLTDFGVAYAGGGTATTVGTLIGTPDFLSPEQVRGERATAASDLYSLGCVVFQLVTGLAPFTGDTPVAVATARLDTPPPSARALNPAVPPALDRAIARAMATSPWDRFPNAAALAEALRRAAATDPSVTQVLDLAPPPTVAFRPGGGGPRTLPNGPGPGPAPGPGVLPPSAPPARLRRRHPWRWFWVLLGLAAAVALAADIVHAWTKAEAPQAIPAWTGSTFDAASAAARTMGFTVQRVDRSSVAAAGTVLATTPGAGTKLKRGQPVTMEVSLGNLLSLPSVTSMTVTDATTLLKARGLTVAISSQTVPGATDNEVAAETPAAGTVVAKGSAVTLVVTKVPPPAPSPGFPGNVLDPLLNLFGLGGSPTPAPKHGHGGG